MEDFLANVCTVEWNERQDAGRTFADAVVIDSGPLVTIGLSGTWAWAVKEPLVFPSLGATAFLIFETPTAEIGTPRNTIVGHLVGVAAGVFSLVVFGLVHIAPGNPIDLRLPPEASPDVVAQVKAAFGFDKPLYTQYGDYLWGIARGNFGTSISDNRPITQIISQNGAATLELTFFAMLVAIIVGVFVGLVAGRFRDSGLDVFGRMFGILIYALVRSLYPARIGGRGRTQRFTLLAAFGAATTFALLLFGSNVTARDAALIFPDWPLMGGTFFPPLNDVTSAHVVHRWVAAVVGLPFGMFDGDKQIGFARVITDCATFAYIGDVYILEAYRGRGLSKWLMSCVVSHPNLQGLRRWLLATRDAHGLYRQFGFTESKTPERWMEIAKADIYKRLSE